MLQASFWAAAYPARKPTRPSRWDEARFDFMLQSWSPDQVARGGMGQFLATSFSLTSLLYLYTACVRGSTQAARVIRVELIPIRCP